MPGVLIVEALAQVGAAVMLSCPEFKGKLVYFGGIEHCRFRKKSGAGRCADAGSGKSQHKGPLELEKLRLRWMERQR